MVRAGSRWGFCICQRELTYPRSSFIIFTLRGSRSELVSTRRAKILMVVFDRNWRIIRQKERVSAEKSLPKLSSMLFRLEHYLMVLRKLSSFFIMLRLIFIILRLVFWFNFQYERETQTATSICPINVARSLGYSAKAQTHSNRKAR